jgi:Laminin N-terminal (Domain VI)
MEKFSFDFFGFLFAALRLLDSNTKQQGGGGGLWPAVFNVAANAKITTNATCGQQKPEDYCKMVDAHPQRYIKNKDMRFCIGCFKFVVMFFMLLISCSPGDMAKNQKLIDL